ncbi:TSCPD domain-containing protein [Planomonospora algeriensis]
MSPVLVPRPNGRHGMTRRFEVGGAQGYLITSMAADGTLAEVMVRLGKHGLTLMGLADALHHTINLGLRHGAPVVEVVQALLDATYDPRGMTNDPEVPTTSSITDYVARRLALDFVPYGERVGLGVLTPAEQTALSSRRTAAADDEAAALRPSGRLPATV